MKIGDYDDGYDEEPVIDGSAALYVMGAIDELRSLGIIEMIAGDPPLTDNKQRRHYRQLKRDGFKPTMSEVEVILSKCVCADDQALFRRLFQGIIDDGWDKIRELRAEAKRDETNDGPDDFYRPDGAEVWIPL